MPYDAMPPLRWSTASPASATSVTLRWSRRRTFIANDLATDHGITSIIIENPYYGQRKPKGQMGSSIRYITDLMLIGFGCMAETSVVLRYARAMGIQGKMGITGISLGGFNAAIAA